MRVAKINESANSLAYKTMFLYLGVTTATVYSPDGAGEMDAGSEDVVVGKSYASSPSEGRARGASSPLIVDPA